MTKEERIKQLEAALYKIIARNMPAGTDWGDSETVRIAKEALHNRVFDK